MMLSFGSKARSFGIRLQSVFVTDSQIEKSGVETAFFHQAERFGAVFGLLALVPEGVERDGGGFANVSFIINDEYAHSC